MVLCLEGSLGAGEAINKLMRKTDSAVGLSPEASGKKKNKFRTKPLFMHLTIRLYKGIVYFVNNISLLA